MGILDWHVDGPAAQGGCGGQDLSSAQRATVHGEHGSESGQAALNSLRLIRRFAGKTADSVCGAVSMLAVLESDLGG